jgi:hypothetical protein
MNVMLPVSESILTTEEKIAETAKRRKVDTSTGRNGAILLLSCICWTLAGTALFFLLYGLSAQGLSPTGTFVSAYIAGGVGILVSTLWLRNHAEFKKFIVTILGAYSLRVLVGVIFCLQILNPNYFEGNGKYIDKNWEFYWTYNNAITAANSVHNKGEWRTSRIYPTNENKNAYIHTWMGYFLATGASKHALDLAPFNAFHHVVAGVLVVSLALACGYTLQVALLSGVLTAWIPWGFPASIMWRDSVGLTWVVLSVVLLCLGRRLGLFGSILLAIPAAFLAWADRQPYLVAIVFITVLSVIYDQQKTITSVWVKILRFVIVSIVCLFGVYLLWHNISLFAFERHGNQVSNDNMLFRLLVSPLLLLRALAGPFPWFVGSKFNLFVIFDYLFHVFQFALFLIFIIKWRMILSRINILTYSAAIFWLFGFIAGGVHTAYLAVAAPFILPPILDTGANIWKFILISAFFFIVANVLYVSVGLTGSGLILDTTGY